MLDLVNRKNVPPTIDPDVSEVHAYVTVAAEALFAGAALAPDRKPNRWKATITASAAPNTESA